jgi:hypothetical protein
MVGVKSSLRFTAMMSAKVQALGQGNRCNLFSITNHLGCCGRARFSEQTSSQIVARTHL